MDNVYRDYCDDDNVYDYGDDDSVTQFIKNQKYELASRLMGNGIFDLDSD